MKSRGPRSPVEARCECGRVFYCLIEKVFWDMLIDHKNAFRDHTFTVEWRDGGKTVFTPHLPDKFW